MKNFLINENLLLVNETYSSNIFYHSNEPYAIGIIKERKEDKNLIIYINDDKGNATIFQSVKDFSSALEKSRKLFLKFHKNMIENSIENNKTK